MPDSGAHFGVADQSGAVAVRAERAAMTGVDLGTLTDEQIKGITKDEKLAEAYPSAFFTVSTPAGWSNFVSWIRGGVTSKDFTVTIAPAA